jgi:hypothetical protein
MLGNEVHAYFDLLYPAAPGDAFHVMSWRSHPDAPLKNQWVRCADATNLIDHIVQSTPELEIWLGVGLRHPGCTPASDRRGKNEDIYAIPGLWIDLDHSGGVHVAQHLPTPQELLAFIHELPFTFSLLIDTGGGYHGYCLFKEMWLLATPAERHVAALLLRCFQRTIQTRAAERGWKVDCTADLARILRPAGTYNHKTKPCKPATILQEDAIRYNPSDIADAPWLATIEETYTPSTDTGDFPQPPLDPIVNGCRWLQHCRDDAAALPEPEWYVMLGIVGRCVEGEQIAHAWSAPYPRYTAAETAQKLRHALQYGPRTCSTIRFDLGGEEHCRTCQHWQKIKSPIVLGLPRMQDSQQHRHR